MKFVFACILFFSGFFSAAQDTAVVFRLYLVGDAGEHSKPGPALQLLGKQLNGLDSAAVVFLGDNVYPHGFDPAKYKTYPFRDTAACNHLASQLKQLRDFHGSAYVIPGNHDWLAQKRKGAYALEKEELETKNFMADSCPYLINSREERFLPSSREPGPVAVQPFAGFRLILFDSQWFLQSVIKGGAGHMSPHKRKKMLALQAHRLDSMITAAEINNEQVILAMHHPVFTNGAHSGHLRPLHWLIDYSPLKFLGWLGVDRLLSQDMIHPRYRKMRKALLPVIGSHKNLVVASGHDHNLQYFSVAPKLLAGNNTFIVSGAGSKLNKLKKKKKFESKFQDDKQTGFFCVEYLKNGQKRIRIYQADGRVTVF